MDPRIVLPAMFATGMLMRWACFRKGLDIPVIGGLVFALWGYGHRLGLTPVILLIASAATGMWSAAAGIVAFTVGFVFWFQISQPLVDLLNSRRASWEPPQRDETGEWWLALPPLAVDTFRPLLADREIRKRLRHGGDGGSGDRQDVPGVHP